MSVSKYFYSAHFLFNLLTFEKKYIKLFIKKFDDIMAIERHIQHIRTNNLEYVKLPNGISDIPVGNSITTLNYLPTSEQITNDSPKYIYVSTSDGLKGYFQLKGKSITPGSLKDGELVISYKKGYESISIKNDNNEIIDFYPIKEIKNNVIFLRMLRDISQLVADDNGIVTIEIPYTTLETNGINASTAVVFTQEYFSGKQIIPDVTFDNNTSSIKILINKNQQYNPDNSFYLIIKIFGCSFI